MIRTAAEIIDYVSTFLLKQGRHSRSEIVCLYYAEDGARCAIGCLIPGDLYEDKFESRTLRWICEASPELAKHILPSDMDKEEGLHYLQELQKIHDNYAVEHWKGLLKDLATRYEQRKE